MFKLQFFISRFTQQKNGFPFELGFFFLRVFEIVDPVLNPGWVCLFPSSSQM